VSILLESENNTQIFTHVVSCSGTREWTILNTTGDKPERRAYHTAIVPDGESPYMYLFGGATSANTEKEGRYSPEQAVIYRYRFGM